MNSYALHDERSFRETGVLALDLVNTRDPYAAEPERLGGVADLERFLAEHDLAGAVTARDLEACRALRAELRAAVGAGDAAELARRLDAVAGALVVAPTLEADGAGGLRLGVRPRDGAPVVERLAVHAVASLADAVSVYGAVRLRTCAADPCEDAFVDTSRNGTRRYCSPRCANRRNAALHRARQRG
jgi:predicted RNA-binding Zn ribbon-like protein